MASRRCGMGEILALEEIAMPDLQARIDVLESELELAKERIRQLEEAFGMTIDAPLMLRLTGSEARVLGVLLTRDMVHKPQIMAALYNERIHDDEIPETKIVDVFVCKMRKKLKRFGVDVETVWGQGYKLSPDSRRLVLAMGEGVIDPASAGLSTRQPC